MAIEKQMQELEHAINCCNGRVGRELVALAKERKDIQELIAPKGVEILRKGIEAGMRVKDDINCCNGQVGKNPIEDVVTALSGS